METPKYLEYADKIENNTHYFSEKAKQEVKEAYEGLKDVPEYKDSELVKNLKKAYEYAKEHTWTQKQAKNELKYHKEIISKNGETEKVNVLDGINPVSEMTEQELTSQIDGEDYYKINGEFVSVAEYNKQHGIQTTNTILADTKQEISNNTHCEGGVCNVDIKTPKQTNTNKQWANQINISSNNTETIETTNGKLFNVDDSNFQEIINRNGKTLIAFTQDGCPPCEELERNLNNNINNLPINFGIANINYNNQLNAINHNITQTPTIFLYENGKLVKQLNSTSYNDILNEIA